MKSNFTNAPEKNETSQFIIHQMILVGIKHFSQRYQELRNNMDLLFPLCLLLALIAEGNGLQCLQCLDNSGRDCDGNAVTCLSDSQVCTASLVQDEIDTSKPENVAFLQANINRNQSKYLFLRDCGDPRDCQDPVILLRTPYNRMVTTQSCCTSDQCKAEVPKLLLEGPLNGLTCPGCLTIYSSSCETQIPVFCRDNENNCFTFSSQPQNYSNDVLLAMSGCASQSACDMEILNGQKIQCWSGGCGWNLPLTPRLLLLLMVLVHGLHSISYS